MLFATLQRSRLEAMAIVQAVTLSINRRAR